MNTRNKYKKTKDNKHRPFTYLIRHKPSGLVYYGARYSISANPDTLWKRYFTSSKVVHALIDKDGEDAFDFEVRKTFDTVEECIQWEERVLRRMKVRHHPKFINIDTSQRPSDNRGMVFINDGEVTMRIKECMPVPDGWVRGVLPVKQRDTRKRTWFHDPDTGEMFHVPDGNTVQEHWEPGRGRAFYDDHSKKLKDKNYIWINDGTESKFHPLAEPIPDGWVKGIYRSEEQLEKMRENGKRSKGRRWITNGIKERTIQSDEPLPDGFWFGKKKRGRSPLPN